MRHLTPHDPLPSDDSSALPHASPSTDLETGLHLLAEIKRRGLSYETAAARIELVQNMLVQMNADSESSAEARASFQVAQSAVGFIEDKFDGPAFEVDSRSDTYGTANDHLCCFSPGTLSRSRYKTCSYPSLARPFSPSSFPFVERSGDCKNLTRTHRVNGGVRRATREALGPFPP